MICLCLAGVGDTLTFTPFLNQLKKEYPDSHIDVAVMFGASKSLLNHNSSIRNVFHIPFLEQNKLASLKQVWQLRREKYDLSIAAFPSNRLEYNLIQLIIGGRRVGHQYLKGGWKMGHFFKNKTVLEDIKSHVVEENWKLFEALGVRPQKSPGPLDFPLTSNDKQFALEWLQKINPNGKPVFGIHGGTSPLKNHVKRRWDPRKFGALAQKIVDHKKAVVLVFGGPEELELKNSIRNAGSEAADSIFLVNQTSLSQSAALIAQCKMMISNDSSLMHVSAAVQTPVVALFAYTFPDWVHPWQVLHRIVRKDLKCSPCFYYSPQEASCPANLNFVCATSIDVDEVWQALEELESEI